MSPDPAPTPLTITTELAARGPAAAIVLTDEQVASITGGAKVAPVRVTVNGGTTVAGRIAKMRGESMIGFSKATRAEAGVEIGETVTAVITLDDAPREVDVPEDLAAALAAEPGARAQFDELSFTNRKEWARWVREAKRPETRERRVAETVEKVAAGQGRR